MSAKAIHCRDCARHFIPHETRRPTDLCWRCEGKRQQQRAAGEARCEVCNAVLAPHWLGTVCGFCTASQSGRELDWEEVDELLRKAHELRPMGNPTLNVAATSEWKDSSLDSWGRRRSGNRATPSGGNCLQGAIATALQVAPEKVPDPSPHFNGDEDCPSPTTTS